MSASGSNNLIAIRDRREQVIECLSDGFANDLLDDDEFERRLDFAYQATSIAALDELIDDLTPATGSTPELKSTPSDATATATAAESTALVTTDEALVPARPEHKQLTSVMGNLACKGRWTVARRINANAVMGNLVLDFREALLPPGVTIINAKCIMGSIEIYVPPDVAVETEVSSLLGDVSDVHRAPAVQDDSVVHLVIRGYAFMGSVHIKTRLPGESSWQAWKRERHERKRLAEARRQRILGDGS